MNRQVRAITLLLCIAGVLLGMAISAQAGIVGTKHDLSSINPNPLVTIKSFTENRICIFCHTPHNAKPQTPLWNRNLSANSYTLLDLYNSTTMLAKPTVPTGPSRLCLSCHDGTIALGKVLSQQTEIPMTGSLAGRSSNLGTSLAKDHPVSFSYYYSLPNPELSTSLPQGLLFYGSGVIHCTTCHDPHDNTNKKFLRVNSENSRLCKLCHLMNGWSGSSHNASTKTWSGNASTDPYPWPRTGSGTDFIWTNVQSNGCENCHAPHSAVGQKRLLNCFTVDAPNNNRCSTFNEEGVCLPCHNGTVATKNIIAQLNKPSNHRVSTPSKPHDPTEDPLWGSYTGHVECVDCHNPHMVNSTPAAPPAISGKLAGVSGVAIGSISAVKPANYEYEICFKCHSSTDAQIFFLSRALGLPIQRWASPDYNTRSEFQTTNPSYHPVAGAIPSSERDDTSLKAPTWWSTLMPIDSLIYCTDCHNDDGASRGPHGSDFAPILRKQYEIKNYNLGYNSANFALCFACHEETTIMSDTAFQKHSSKGGHSGHVQYPVYTSCATCHDPHGVQNDGIGSHTRLINFASPPYVSALTGSSSKPYFTDKGARSGSCTLVCHGVEHRDGTHSYP